MISQPQCMLQVFVHWPPPTTPAALTSSSPHSDMKGMRVLFVDKEPAHWTCSLNMSPHFPAWVFFEPCHTSSKKGPVTEPGRSSE